MRVVLIMKKRMIKDTLPKNIIQNYWITDKTNNYERKLINIKINNEKYEIISNDYSKIIDSKYLKIKDDNLTIMQTKECIIPSVILHENAIYPIYLNDAKEVCILYCLPDYEDTFTHIDIVETNEITIGTDDNNSIVYKRPFVLKKHARIFKFKGKWTIENYDSKYGIFVNDFPVYDNTKDIFNGDIIFIMGLQIVMIKDSLYINNPHNKVEINDNNLILSKEKNVIKNNEQYIKSKINKPKEEYYSRSPRMIPQIKKEKVKIDEPPDIKDDRQKPMILVLGSSITMGVMMMASLATTIQGIARGTAGAFEIFLGFITTIAMLIAMIVIPVLDVKWEKRYDRKYEQKRQKKYKQYLNKKRNLINEIKNKQRQILYENYLSADECTRVILSNSHRLWERKIEDEDFLDVRIGIGKVPLKIEISYPQEKFAMVDDNLIEELNNIIKDSQTIDNSPITVSLRKNNISAIVSKNNDFTIKYMKNIILQLITFQNYNDLKLVFLLNKNNSRDWQYVKMLPYVWDDSKQIRFFADNYDDINELSKYLEEQLDNRINSPNKEKNTYYLIITDDYKQIENISFISNISNMKNNIGFSLLCITDDLYSVPSECKTFIEIKDKTKGILYESEENTLNQVELQIEPIITVFYEKITQKLANIPILIKKGATSLPSNYTFLEMYNVGNIEQLDILGRWRKNDSTLSLKAPVGIDNNGMLIFLDVHEKFHGPHGLIAGSTGSGKSEFIITYILSLAINYHPNDVTFLLIDYKGGGLAGAFQKNNIKLPHLVGTITNINKYGLKRSLTSIQSELRRRQVIFNEARNMTNEGTIDIYKYQKLYHDGIVKEPIPHLFIICDEFAELKQQQLDFMDELISVSRIGRSLGVHLILATQKPSGIVDDQIRSNSKFGICLKVQDVLDSQDVIARPDAAFLKNPGQFYLKVGQNEYYVLGQSGWSGAKYISSNVPIKKFDSSVEFISNIGLPIKKIDDKERNNLKNEGEQLTNILEYIYKLAIKENIENKNLWLQELPENIYVKDLRNKYNVRAQKNMMPVVIGEYDNPFDQKQGIVELDIAKRNNLVIYGNAESGKETLLSTIVYDLMTTYNTQQAQIYILDFGTEALKIYKNSPHVGDIIFMGQDEKLETFFEMLQRNIRDRKQILSGYNGDYNLYISKGNKMPITVIMINNYETFSENYEDKYDDLFLALTREGPKCGILFIVTATTPSAMRYRLTSNFNKKIALQLNNDDDYFSIFEKVKDKRPTHIFGRGLVIVDDEILEFQTAKICEITEYNENIEQAIERLNKENEVKAMPVPTLPKKIEIKVIKDYLKDISKVPIGLIKKNLDVYRYNFAKNFMTIISSNDINDAIELLTYVFEEIKQLKNVKTSILNADEIESSKKKAYNNFVKEIKKDIKKESEEYTLCAIIGIEKFLSENIIDESEFSEFLGKVKEKGKHSFIIIENADYLIQHSYDEWYTNFIDESSGIWVGNGIEKQMLIKPNFSMEGLENNCGNSYGYVVSEGIPTLIKFIGIEEEGDEDE